MARTVRELMKKDPIQLSGSATAVHAARKMRDANVGAIVVSDGGRLEGILTDRDIAVRCVAEGRDPAATPISQICSKVLNVLSPDDDIDRAVQLMREKAVRRVPVVDAQRGPVGILSLGDLARERDPRSVLGQISAAAPNQ